MANPDNVPSKISIGELLNSGATVDVLTAAGALGIGRTKAYELVKRGEFPCRVIKIGDIYRVSTPALLELILGYPVMPDGYRKPGKER